jgi:hypothetical protein
MPETSEAYDRGHRAGGVDERLNEYGRHFDKINGSIDRFTGEIREMRMVIQGLTDAANADRATAITLAAALEKADLARRNAAERTWSPLARIGTGVTIVVAVVSFAVWLASVIQ